MKTKYAIGTYNPDGTPKKSKRKNMTYKGKPTKYQEKKMRNKDLLFLIVIWIVSIPCVAIGQFTNNFTIDDSMDVQEAPVEIVDDKGGAGSIEVIDFVKTPAPKLSVEQQIRDIAYGQGFNHTDYLIKLAICESSLNPEAIGDNGMSRGLYQIHKGYHPQVKDSQAKNIRWSTIWTMEKINEGKQNLWSCDKIVKGIPLSEIKNKFSFK